MKIKLTLHEVSEIFDIPIDIVRRKYYIKKRLPKKITSKIKEEKNPFKSRNILTSTKAYEIAVSSKLNSGERIQLARKVLSKGMSLKEIREYLKNI